MTRISDEELGRLKREVSLKDLAEARGIELIRRGKEWMGLCPFHEEQSASLAISEEKNLFHCFGCGAKGSVIDWVKKTEGVSFRHAVEILRANEPARLLSPLAPSPARRSSVPKLASPLSPDADDEKLLAEVAAYYHETLTKSPNALAYLEKRGLMDAEMLRRFHLGVPSVALLEKADRMSDEKPDRVATASGAEQMYRSRQIGQGPGSG